MENLKGKVTSLKGWKLLYKATKNGFDTSNFHKNCDAKGPTVSIIVSSNGFIFGGFTPANWNSSNNYTFDQKSFLFSVKNASGKHLIKLENNGPNHSNSYSIYGGSGYGPTFGGGHDLYICTNSNTSNSSYSNLGHSYSLPNHQYGSQEIKNYLAGSYNFTTTEIEVYSMPLQ